MDIVKIVMAALVLMFLLAAFAVAAPAKLKLNPVFGEHMVLQRDIPLEIFGTAGPGKTVTVEIAGQKASGVVSGRGEWTVKLQIGRAHV
jgi:sialate O-acetylesterase